MYENVESLLYILILRSLNKSENEIPLPLTMLCQSSRMRDSIHNTQLMPIQLCGGGVIYFGQWNGSCPCVNWCVTRPNWVNRQIPYVDGLVLECSNSSATAMELLQSCTKPSMCLNYYITAMSLYSLIFAFVFIFIHSFICWFSYFCIHSSLLSCI